MPYILLYNKLKIINIIYLPKEVFYKENPLTIIIFSWVFAKEISK